MYRLAVKVGTRRINPSRWRITPSAIPPYPKVAGSRTRKSAEPVAAAPHGCPPARACASWSPTRRGIDLLEERVLLAEVERDAGKIRLLAVEIAPHGGDRLGDFGHGRAGLGAGHPAQQNAFGRFGASGRQLEARDAHIAPGDAAVAAAGFEDEIMLRCLAHHMAPAF